MNIELWFAYLATITILIITPGPMVMLSINHAIYYGPKATKKTALGGVSASMLFMLLSACGLSAIFSTSPMLFNLLRILGGIYLIFLSFIYWHKKPANITPKNVNTTDKQSLYKKGLLLGISNPKDILFFSLLFPQFIDFSRPKLTQLIILAITWLIVDFSTMMFYALSADKVAGIIASPNKIMLIHKITAVIFLIIALALLTYNH